MKSKMKSSEFWTKAKRKELRNVISKGLSVGLGGRGIPGEMCVEEAICWVRSGTSHDYPTCVALEDRALSISLNDTIGFSSKKARAKALMPLAFAQLNTKGKSRAKWCERVCVGIMSNFAKELCYASNIKNTKVISAFKKCKTMKDVKKVLKDCETMIEDLGGERNLKLLELEYDSTCPSSLLAIISVDGILSETNGKKLIKLVLEAYVAEGRVPNIPEGR